MKSKIKKLWQEALRSGEYKQTKHQLRKQKGKQASFCCLGVLCNLHAQAHPKIAAENTNPERYMGCSGVLPSEVRKWAGVDTSEGGEVLYKDRYRSLVSLNDSGVKFKTVAKLLDQL